MSPRAACVPCRPRPVRPTLLKEICMSTSSSSSIGSISSSSSSSSERPEEKDSDSEWSNHSPRPRQSQEPLSSNSSREGQGTRSDRGSPGKNKVEQSPVKRSKPTLESRSRKTNLSPLKLPLKTASSPSPHVGQPGNGRAAPSPSKSAEGNAQSRQKQPASQPRYASGSPSGSLSSSKNKLTITLNATTVASTALMTPTLTAATTSTNSPPYSPRSPREKPHFRQLDAESLASKNKQLAVADAWSIADTDSSPAALHSVLSQAMAIAPAERGGVLTTLAKPINFFSKSEKAACLGEIRKLAAGLPVRERQALVNELLKQGINRRDRDDDDDAFSLSDAAADKEQWGMDQSRL